MSGQFDPHRIVGLSLALADLISDPRNASLRMGRGFHTFRSYFIHVVNNRNIKGMVWHEELNEEPEGRIRETPKNNYL